jgi:4-aminobutyrate aminotransferase/(S)-3-amino-2-methylpropionate transaminase
MLKNALPNISTALPGPKARAMLERRDNAVPSAIRCAYPIVIKRGEGAMIEDVDGNIFLDWVGGVGVMNIGYSHPDAVAAVKEQADKFFHGMMNIVTHEPYVACAEKLNSIVPVRGDRKKTMFANSGAEAIENAVKIARSFTGRPNVIVFSGAFHGRTLLAAAMTSKKTHSAGCGPFPDGVYRAEFPYLYRAPGDMDETAALAHYVARLDRIFDDTSLPEHVAAIVVEPVQGEGGFVPAPIPWVCALRKICDEKGILLIADEIQTGFARSGKMFASDYWRDALCEPDIIACAKSIAAGLPLSAVSARAEIFDGVRPGIIGGTFGGNAVACASALATIAAIERDGLCARSREIALKCRNRFNEWKDRYEAVGDVRGIGCMLGIEFVRDKKSKTPDGPLVADLVSKTAHRGLIVESAGTYGNVIRFLCPLVVTDEQLEAGFAIFEETLKECLGGNR